jgi:hypothetical protein
MQSSLCAPTIVGAEIGAIHSAHLQLHFRLGSYTARFYMRAVQILGAILILGGLFVLIKSPSYSSDKSVLKIGDVEAKVSQQHVIPPWIGGAGVVAGVILIVVGARKP